MNNTRTELAIPRPSETPPPISCNWYNCDPNGIHQAKCSAACIVMLLAIGPQNIA